jgi:hypothetical protein
VSLKDWSDPLSRPVNEHGAKAAIGRPKSAYSEWHRTIGHGCFANDVDWIEWRSSADGKSIVPVAIIETTFYEDKPEWRHLLTSYCGAALARFKRDAQHRVTMTVADALHVPAYFTIARQDLAVFFVCRLRDEVWRQMDEAGYRAWLLGLTAPPVLAGCPCAKWRASYEQASSGRQVRGANHA